MSKRANDNLWGGRFSSSPASIMRRINASIEFDKRLFRQDIEASLAHVRMLGRQDIIARDDVDLIAAGLETIRQEIESDNFDFSEALEDIHMHIESRLHGLIGVAAFRLHTGRSRNDQVVTDMRMWLREACSELESLLLNLVESLLHKAEPHIETLMPGYTHLQVAQPLSFAHHLLAYVEMFGRDYERFCGLRERMNESPLGAAALAGTSFPIDRESTAAALGFSGVMRNSVDAVSARDFLLEFLSAGVIHSLHLSRLAEELVLWCSDAFGFIVLSDSFTTGSSIMPQKRNPDAAELVRAKSAVLLGHFTSLAAVMKGLPLAYAKDMQEDKVPIFAAVEALDLSMRAMAGMVSDMRPRPQAMRRALDAGFPTATDLADRLVRESGMAFREAHRVSGELTRLAAQKGCGLADLSLAEMQAICPQIGADIYEVLRPESALHSRNSFGGTAPARVREAIIERRAWLAACRKA